MSELNQHARSSDLLDYSCKGVVTTMALVDDLAIYNTQKPFWVDIDPGWRLFVSDYIDLIRANAKRYNVSAEVAESYYQDTTGLIRHIDPSIDGRRAWMARLISGYKSDIDYVAPGIFYIPTEEYVSTLYNKYQSTRLDRVKA